MRHCAQALPDFRKLAVEEFLDEIRSRKRDRLASNEVPSS